MAAGAVAASFAGASAQAAPVIVDLTFTPQSGGSSGTGFFEIDSSRLAPLTFSDETHLTDFGATFINVPDVGSVVFTFDELSDSTIKTFIDGEFIALEFDATDADTGYQLTKGSNLVLDDFSGPEQDKEKHDLLVDLLDDESTLVTTYVVDAENPFAIPEAGTIALLATGVAGLGLIRRRRLLKTAEAA